MRSLTYILVAVVLLAGCDSATEPESEEALTFDLVAQIAVGDRPLDVEVTGSGYLVANSYSSLMLIDPVTLSVSDSLVMAGFFPHELLYIEGTTTVFLVDDASGKLRAVSIPDLEVQWTTTVPTLYDPFYSYVKGLVYDPDHIDYLYTLETRTGVIAIINTAGAVLDTVRYREPRPSGMVNLESGLALAIDPVLDRLFVCNRSDGKVYAYSTNTYTKLDSLGGPGGQLTQANTLLTDTVNGQLILNEPMAYLQGDSYIGTLSVYDSQTLDLDKEVDIPDWPDKGGLAWVEEGVSLAVVSGTHLLEFSVPDYRLLYDVDMGSTGSRIAYDSARGYFIVSIEDDDVVRIYARAGSTGSRR